MAKRNFSSREYWLRKVENWQPILAFKGTTKQDWEQWYRQSYPKLLELLGDFPQKVDLDAEVEYAVEDGDLIRERVVFNSEDYMSVPCQVLRPETMKPDNANPAIICSHGHGAYGKDAVSGFRALPDLETEIQALNYNYGEQMARAGYLTISPDLRAFGERLDGVQPYPGTDQCNLNFNKGVIMGLYPLTLNIWDIKCCIDYLETRPEVNPKRIGMMGLSQGGTMTTFVSAVDKRIKAADIIGYVNPWSALGAKRDMLCGSQVVPEIFKYFDTDEIAGLIAPRPLLLEMGIYDDTFFIQDMLKGYEGVKQIYKAAGAADDLWAEVHAGGHCFAGNKAFQFFQQYL